MSYPIFSICACNYNYSGSFIQYLVFMHVIIITEDDLSNIYTVEEAVHKIGFGVFQILLSFFNLGKAMCF